jgi:hypothetical protein
LNLKCWLKYEALTLFWNFDLNLKRWLKFEALTQIWSVDLILRQTQIWNNSSKSSRKSPQGSNKCNIHHKMLRSSKRRKIHVTLFIVNCLFENWLYNKLLNSHSRLQMSLFFFLLLSMYTTIARLREREGQWSPNKIYLFDFYICEKYYKKKLEMMFFSR